MSPAGADFREKHDAISVVKDGKFLRITNSIRENEQLKSEAHKIAASIDRPSRILPAPKNDTTTQNRLATA